ncbi:hypothetical protein [Acinetobacter rudis]|uniref:Type VI secretion system secreted protein VgrG n=1 Tax=Acinetobacter rudis TaxID=632955 RepID=A0AAW8JAN5_9GAMM|nr:hypothetical protein [Acinetobacter rudis]MDQ8936845.1 hypothetical protein [Acinetobacter rudis]MDQ8952213.1 hypothetical protein [Acinetobacter rudis]MDQ9019065.1 hypothetical protein [Acinetobacter rudis]
MSQCFQLRIFKNGKLLGNFESQTTQALFSINEVFSYLQPHNELSFELYRVVEDSRLLLQKDGVLQLLSTTEQYLPYSLENLSDGA